MQYTIYPCTELFLEKIMKKIRAVAKQTEMKIVSIDKIDRPEKATYLINGYDTIIILEHIPNKKKYRFGL